MQHGCILFRRYWNNHVLWPATANEYRESSPRGTGESDRRPLSPFPAASAVCLVKDGKSKQSSQREVLMGQWEEHFELLNNKEL